jgi:4'-phosphopantetheinyl transferase
MKWRFCKITDITKTEYEAIYNGLTPSRRAHIDRMKQQDDRLRSLAVTHLLNSILEEFGVCDARLEVLENGKPHLVGSDLFFSLSHSEEGVAAVVSGTPVGIDIEKIKPVTDKLINYVCNENEREYIESGDDKEYRFFAVWTAKEAYFKKNGGVGVRAVDTTTFEKSVYEIDDYLITIV